MSINIKSYFLFIVFGCILILSCNSNSIIDKEKVTQIEVFDSQQKQSSILGDEFLMVIDAMNNSKEFTDEVWKFNPSFYLKLTQKDTFKIVRVGNNLIETDKKYYKCKQNINSIISNLVKFE